METRVQWTASCISGHAMSQQESRRNSKSSPAGGDDAVHPLRNASFLCQGTPGGSLQKLTWPSARGLSSEIQAPFSPMWQACCLFCCQYYPLITTAVSLFSSHPTEVSINRNHASWHPHSGELNKPGSSNILSYIMLFIFLTIFIALVNRVFYFKAIGFDPGWPNYTPPASSAV